MSAWDTCKTNFIGKEVQAMEQQEIKLDQEIPELDIEFVGELEDVTAGWTGPTDDTIDGDWTP
jgi:hypothetical protein